MRVVILFNPISGSGRGERLARALDVAAQSAGLETVVCPTRLEPLETWLDEVIEPADALIVVGGDGAMRLAAPAAMRCATPIYHFPMGTENLFAREFSAGNSVDAAIASVRAMNVTSIDVGLANGRVFLLMASLGLDAEVVADLSARRTGSISHLSYAAPIARQVLTLKPPRFTVHADGELVVDDEPGMLVIANCRQYGVRLDPAFWADTGDGLLDLAFMPARSRLGMGIWAARCRLRRQRRHPRVIEARAASFTIIRHDAAFQMDGDPPEPIDGRDDDRHEPIEMRIADQRLRVITASA